MTLAVKSSGLNLPALLLGEVVKTPQLSKLHNRVTNVDTAGSFKSRKRGIPDGMRNVKLFR